MYQSGTIFDGNEVTQYYVMNFLLSRQEGEKGSILLALELFPLHPVDDLHRFIPEYLAQQGFRQDELFYRTILQVSFNCYVIDLCTSCHSHVRR